MAVEDLARFLSQRIAQGYSEGALRKYLLQQGYHPSEISMAFNMLKAGSPRTHSRGKMIAFALFAFGTLLSIASAWLYFSSQQAADTGPRNIELSAALLSKEYVPGKPLEISLHLSGEKLNRPESVLVTYSVSDKEGNIIYYKSETLSLYEDRYETRKIRLPSGTSSGSFVLNTKATVYNKNFVSSYSFVIKGLPKKEGKPQGEEEAEEKQRRFRVLPVESATFSEPAEPRTPPGRGMLPDDVVRMQA